LIGGLPERRPEKKLKKKTDGRGARASRCCIKKEKTLKKKLGRKRKLTLHPSIPLNLPINGSGGKKK